MEIICVLITHFCAKAELRRNPALRDRPMAVVTKEDNNLIVIDKSQEAKPVKIGMSYQNALSVCKELEVIQADFKFYSLISEKIACDLNNKSPKVEAFDLGVTYVDISGLERMYPTQDILIESLLKDIPKEFNPRIGIAGSKFFSYVAAIHSKPNNFLKISNNFSSFLHAIHLDMLPVSSWNKAKLHDLDINNLVDVSNWSIDSLQLQFGIKDGKKLWELCRGIDNDYFYPLELKNQLKTSACFDEPLVNKQSIVLAMSYMLDELLRDNKFRNRSARGLSISAQTTNSLYWNKKIKFKEPLFRKTKMLGIVESVLEVADIPGPLSDLSIELMKLTDDFSIQKSLFSFSRKEEDLLESIKQLEIRLGCKVPIYEIKEIEPWSRIPERRTALMRILP